MKIFQENDSSWAVVLGICSSGNLFNNQYLWFFSVSTLEVSTTTRFASDDQSIKNYLPQLTITKTWNRLDMKAKAHIRDTLWLTYCNFPTNVGAMQRDKIAQLIALIAKRQDEHGSFCQQIVCLLKSKFLLGITLLKATFGEISSTKHDCTFQTKKNFVQG